MAMAFTERQVLFHSKSLGSFLLVFSLFLGVVSCETDEFSNTDGVWEGNAKFEFNNGVLELNGAPYSGTYSEMYESGGLKNTCTYQFGLKHGKFKSWYATGEEYERRYYMKGIKIGVHEGMWPNKRRKFIYVFNDAGEYHGQLLEWYESGQLFKKGNYINGHEDGRQLVYKSDGRIRSNYKVINGEKFGLIGLKRCHTVVNSENEIVYEN